VVDVTKIEVVEERNVRPMFSGGSERVLDLKSLLWGSVFKETARPSEHTPNRGLDHLAIPPVVPHESSTGLTRPSFTPRGRLLWRHPANPTA
jgi:hypothetical protein